MAINPVSKLQGLAVNLKPSRMIGRDEGFYADPDRRRVIRTTHVQGGRLVTYWEAPWAGVIEEIKATQQIAGGGGGGNNSCDVQVGPLGSLASVYAAAGDFVNLLDNDVAGTTSLRHGTATVGLGRLQTCTDGETRTRFNKGDLVYLVSTAGGGALGTVQLELTVAKELPTAGV